MVNEQDVHRAYDEYQGELANYNNASEDLDKAKFAVEQARYKALFDGELEGKNVEAREASFRGKYPGLIDKLFLKENEYKRAKFLLDLAKLYLDRIKLLIRLEEIGVKNG